MSKKSDSKKELPCSTCKGQCCTYPVFSPDEYNALRFHGPKIPIGAKVSRFIQAVSYDPIAPFDQPAVVIHLPSGVCPFLGDKGCTIPELKPKVCRDYGVVKTLPCQYLYPKEAAREAKKRMDKTVLNSI